MTSPTDLEIARSRPLRPIGEVAAAAGIPPTALVPYGHKMAKLALDFCHEARSREAGTGLARPSRLILVTAMTPTTAGEGKTTTSIGLADGLRRIGQRALLCLREPSLGPVFGAKGGATGGGQAQVAPMEEINLHFTGDFHAITSAHNLLAALIDNHLHHGNTLGLAPASVALRRVLDLNDRALRQVVAGLGGRLNGPPRESGFDITPASEVMAVFCLSKDLADLRRRLAAIVIGENETGELLRAADLKADGALAALLKDALAPNLVQTLEGTPALVHGGPFANIAHGCNSVLATATALGLADYVVTEAGFGSDLGAEKFFNIKCRQAGLRPAAAVIVATLRALRLHGGVAASAVDAPDAQAAAAGLSNLRRHVENVRRFGPRVVVALNRRTGDPADEIALVRGLCAELGVRFAECDGWARGGAGAAPLAEAVAEAAGAWDGTLRLTYPDELPLLEKMERIAREVYGAEGVAPEPAVRARLERLQQRGFGTLPVCMAKTQYSFSADPKRLAAPAGFTIPIREVRLSAGAGFVVALTGDILTMPGLPRVPSAEQIGLDPEGHIVGLR